MTDEDAREAGRKFADRVRRLGACCGASTREIRTSPPPTNLEPRVAVLEQIARNTAEVLAEIHKDIRELRTDNRWLLGITLSGFVGLLGAMAKGFHWI